MPCRLRLYSGEQLLVTTSYGTTSEAGRAVAEFPLGELDVGEGASLRREVSFLGVDGQERPATPDEQNEVFVAMVARMSEISAGEVEPCPRCGHRAAGQDEPYPVRLTSEGPVCFGCWTQEERDRLS